MNQACAAAFYGLDALSQAASDALQGTSMSVFEEPGHSYPNTGYAMRRLAYRKTPEAAALSLRQLVSREYLGEIVV